MTPNQLRPEVAVKQLVQSMRQEHTNQTKGFGMWLDALFRVQLQESERVLVFC